MDGVDHILWINLERASVRRNRMEKMLKRLRIPCIDCCGLRHLFTSPFPKENIWRISAVDGQKDNIFEYIDFDGSRPNFVTPPRRDIKTTFVEFSCLISHVLAIHEFCRCGEPGQVALILEDDMTLDFQVFWGKSVREICAAATAHDPAWDIIQLACISGKRSFFAGAGGGGGGGAAPDFERIDCNNKKGLYSTGAYLIKYESAVNFIKRAFDEKKRTYVLDRVVSSIISDASTNFSVVEDSDTEQEIEELQNETVYYLADHYLYTVNRTYNYKFPYFTAAYNEISTIHRDHEYFHNESRMRYEAFLCRHFAARGEPIFNGLFFATAATASTFIAAAAFAACLSSSGM